MRVWHDVVQKLVADQRPAPKVSLNYMRKAFSFTGFPIRIFMKARRREDLNEILAKKKMFKRKREEEKRRNFKPVRQEDDDMDFED